MARETRTFSKPGYGGLAPFTSTAYTDDGGKTWYWASVNRPVPLDAAKEYGIPVDPVAQEAAIQAHLDKVFADYRANQPAVPSAEEQYEMLAAFGPGAEVVDVISGRRFKTPGKKKGSKK